MKHLLKRSDETLTMLKKKRYVAKRWIGGVDEFEGNDLQSGFEN